MSCMGIIEPPGPVIAIYKGWQDTKTRQKPASYHLPYNSYSSNSEGAPSLGDAVPISSAQRRYQFIASDTPRRPKDSAIRKLIKSHVSKEHADNKHRTAVKLQKARVRQTTPNQDNSHKEFPSLSSPDKNPDFKCIPDVSRLIGYPTALCMLRYPIQMETSAHRLLERYFTCTSHRFSSERRRLQLNTIRSGSWFHYAITDAALLLGLLYAAAVYIDLLEGKTDTSDTISYKTRTISVVNERLRNSNLVDDSTIGAVSCLALGEAVMGNLSSWHIHMRGLREMLRIRQGSYPLALILQKKVRRSDVNGALEYGEAPYLQTSCSKSPISWSKLSLKDLEKIEKGISQLLAPCHVHSDLIVIMTDLAYFSSTLQPDRVNSSSYIDPTAFSEGLCWLKCKLLSFPGNSSDSATENMIDRACRFGALLYIKSIMDEFPHSKTGSSILLKKLQGSLQDLRKDAKTIPLLLWLFTLGAVISKSAERMSFTQGLKELATICGINSFNDDQLSVSKLLSLQQIFGSSLDKLWEDVMSPTIRHKDS